MRGASSVDRFRRGLLLSAPAVLAAPLLNACAGSPVRGAADVAAALEARLAAQDRPGFLALFASTTGAQALGARFFDNLGGRSVTIAAPAPHRLQVRWSLPGEPTVVSEAFLTLAGDQIANLTAATTGTEWLGDQPIVNVESGLVVATATQSQAGRWLAAAKSGLSALGSVLPAGQKWLRPLVLLAPLDLLGFARYAGSGASALAAVTVVPGTSGSQGVRVVVNPLAPNDAPTEAATVTHEAVHAGMVSPRLTGTPGWLVEGIAEALTARAHPSVAATNGTLARSAIENGIPSELPQLLNPDPAGYALAQIAVDAMVHQVGWTAVFAEARARSAPRGPIIADSQVLAWYRDALAALN